MIDQALEALKTYDWGVDPKVLRPINEAIVATHGDANARKDLEKQLAAVLTTDVPIAAKGAVCRALRTVGTSHCVPMLTRLLEDEKLSHMARYALQDIQAPEATKTLVGALGRLPGNLKIGVASSLGARARSGHTVPHPPVAELLGDKDPAVARAGALALGAIGTPEAGSALFAAKTSDASVNEAIADSLLVCAENLLAAGKKSQAKAAYEKILASNPSESVKTAAGLGVKASS